MEYVKEVTPGALVTWVQAGSGLGRRYICVSAQYGAGWGLTQLPVQVQLPFRKGPFSDIFNFSSSKCDLSPNINSTDSGNILSFMSSDDFEEEKQILPNKQKTSNFDVKDFW